jgi:hypothetical protein
MLNDSAALGKTPTYVNLHDMSWLDIPLRSLCIKALVYFVCQVCIIRVMENYILHGICQLRQGGTVLRHGCTEQITVRVKRNAFIVNTSRPICIVTLITHTTKSCA